MRKDLVACTAPLDPGGGVRMLDLTRAMLAKSTIELLATRQQQVQLQLAIQMNVTEPEKTKEAECQTAKIEPGTA